MVNWSILITNTNGAPWRVKVDGRLQQLAPGETQRFFYQSSNLHIFMIDFGGRSPAQCRPAANILLVFDSNGGHVQVR